MLELKLEPFPELQGKRIYLTELRPSDETALYAIRSSEAVQEYLDREVESSHEEVRDILNNLRTGVYRGDWVFWAIRLQEAEPLIGTICLWNLRLRRYQAEIGYDLHPAHWGKGYMSEAVQLVVTYSFEVAGFRRLVATTQSDHAVSAHLLGKNGFLRIESPLHIRKNISKWERTAVE